MSDLNMRAAKDQREHWQTLKHDLVLDNGDKVKVCAKKNTIKNKPPSYVVLLLVQDKQELQVSVNTFTKAGISDADPDAQSACFNFVKGLAQKLKDGADIDQLKVLMDICRLDVFRLLVPSLKQDFKTMLQQ